MTLPVSILEVCKLLAFVGIMFAVSHLLIVCAILAAVEARPQPQAAVASVPPLGTQAEELFSKLFSVPTAVKRF